MDTFELSSDEPWTGIVLVYPTACAILLEVSQGAGGWHTPPVMRPVLSCVFAGVHRRSAHASFCLTHLRVLSSALSFLLVPG